MATWIADNSVAEPIALAHTENETNNGAKVVLRCPWANRWLVVQSLMAQRPYWPYLPITRWIPIDFSIAPAPQIKTSNVPSEEMNAYTYADITFTFGYPEAGNPRQSEGFPGGDSDEVVNYYESYTPNAELICIPVVGEDNDWRLRWGPSDSATALAPGEGGTRLLLGADYVIKWVNMPFVPGAFFNCVGTVNNGTVVTGAGVSFATGTLLCQAPIVNGTVGFDGSETWDIEARMIHRAAPWNQVFNPATGTFQSVYRFEPADAMSGTLQTRYSSSNFNGMLP